MFLEKLMAWIFTDEMRFYLHDGETLLDGMIRTHHKEVRYMCRQGFCGACKMRVKGATQKPNLKQIPLACLDDDEVLACCCLPTGSMVVSYAPCERSLCLQKNSIISLQIFYKIDEI